MHDGIVIGHYLVIVQDRFFLHEIKIRICGGKQNHLPIKGLRRKQELEIDSIETNTVYTYIRSRIRGSDSLTTTYLA